ncbi:MAG TPA: ABC transporter substrate-binding protein, partial [Bacillota bacterium]
MRQRPWSLRLRPAWAVALVLALVTLAACGGGGDASPGAGEPAGEAGDSGSAGGETPSPAPEPAEAVEPIDVTIGIGGQGALVYLATTLAQQLGYYEEEGINAELIDFQGGSRALEALLGGSVDVVSGFYDHTIQLAARGRQLKAFVTMLRYPGLVLAVSPATDKQIESIADLKGAILGVTSPGSSSHLFVNYLLVKNGLTPDDVSATAIGATASAVAAMDQGQVDVGSMVDPAVTQLLHRHPDLRILADTRTGEGVREIFGTSSYPAAVLYSHASWLDENPEAARRLARAIARTLEWIHSHSAQEIADMMPANFR